MIKIVWPRGPGRPLPWQRHVERERVAEGFSRVSTATLQQPKNSTLIFRITFFILKFSYNLHAS